MKNFLLLILLFAYTHATAQKIFGIVFNDKGELLPYASVTIKGTTNGSSANSKGKFFINVQPGTYTIICQHIGFAAQEKLVKVAQLDEEITFILTQQKLEMKEVVVKVGGVDPAYQIMREAIKKRPIYNNEVKAFTCDLYSKDVIKLKKLPSKMFGQKIEKNDKKEMGLDTTGAGILYLSEAISSVASVLPNKFKMNVKSSRVSGSNSFGFAFPTFISLYNNNVIIFSQRLNPRGFVSPVADNALNFYKYKFLGSYWENGKEINAIKVTPKRLYEPLFSGIINITEGDWRIHSLDLVLTKKSALELLDTLKIVQFHVPASKDEWRVKNQLLTFNFNFFGIHAVGNFVNVYSAYVINPIIPKNYFDNVVIKYDTAVNKKTKAYWDSIRPVPLEKEEIKDYQVKDSVYESRKDSMFSKANIDSLKKRQGKIKPLQVFWKGIDRTHFGKTSRYNWGINSLIKNLEYNTAEGITINVGGFYKKYLQKSKMNISVEPNIRYGTSNEHINAWLNVQLKTRDNDIDKKIKRQTWFFSGGQKVLQFNAESPITPLINSISTLLYGQNYLKNYEALFAKIGFNKKYESGFQFTINALYEDRKPLNNTTNFTVFKKDSSNLTVNYPYEQLTAQFTPHKAVIVSIDISYKPGQRYIQLPYSKIPIGSKYPTFSFNYTKGINNILGSNVQFDKWCFAIHDDVNFKLAGLLKYKIGIGGFLNNKQVFIQDYQHFNGNLTIAASEYLNSFQMASYYANSTTASFYALAHVEHHFNGLVTNKIPLFRKLNWHLVAGSNTFYVNEKNNHIEIFAGLENIFKIFRVDFVAAYINGRTPITGIRIGFGGLIGGGVQKQGKNVTISF